MEKNKKSKLKNLKNKKKKSAKSSSTTRPRSKRRKTDETQSHDVPNTEIMTVINVDANSDSEKTETSPDGSLYEQTESDDESQ